MERKKATRYIKQIHAKIHHILTNKHARRRIGTKILAAYIVRACLFIPADTDMTTIKQHIEQLGYKIQHEQTISTQESADIEQSFNMLEHEMSKKS